MLSHGLNFCLLPTNPKREGIFAEFIVLIAQLQHHHPQSPEKHSTLKAKLSDLAHAYCGTPVDAGDFLEHIRECLSAIKPLRSNSNILITKPANDKAWLFWTKLTASKKWTPFFKTKRNFWHSAHQVKRSTPERSNSGYNAACCSCTKTIGSLQIYTILFDRLALNGCVCTAFPKHTKKICHSDLFCLWRVKRNTSWPNISLLFSNRFSLSIRATAYGTGPPLLTSLKLQICTLPPSFSALLTFRVYLLMSCLRKLFKSVLTLSIVWNNLVHLFYGKSLSNLWRWLLLLLSLASKTPCIARSTESPWDHPLDKPLPIFLLATMNLNFFWPLSNRWCTTAIWMTPS